MPDAAKLRRSILASVSGSGPGSPILLRRCGARGPLVICLLAAWACAPRGASPTTAAPGVAGMERSYLALRSLGDTISVARARGQDATPAGESLGSAVRRFDVARARVHHQADVIARGQLSPPDQAATDALVRALDTDLADIDIGPDNGDATNGESCEGTVASLSAADSAAMATLRRHVYACFGRVAARLVVGADTMDRLTISSRMGEADDSRRRHALFLGLAPLWRTVNGDDGERSPYRVLLRGSAPRGTASTSPLDRARMLGVDPATAERWLTEVLDAWRSATPDSLIEPWDYDYVAGVAGRRLDQRVPIDSMLSITLRDYRALGADVPQLGVHYDLMPRAGKTPVAYTTFGSRGHRADAGRGWVRSDSWVFATYATGGIGNLEELIHETGHAVHLAAIRARPAFEDWPDSDPFTEAVPDIAALEVFEPVWQSHFLGDSVPTTVSMRAKYAGVVLDITWALFEVQLYEHPDADPNRVWTALTSHYLHIAPHPELSWWATRGQLIDEPGYMMNYALGAVIVAALRERIRTVHGPFSTGDGSWYGWLSDHLLRFGLSRPTSGLLREFLGTPLSARPLLDDLGRMRRQPP